MDKEQAALIDDLKDYVRYFETFAYLGPWRMRAAARCILLETRRQLIQDYGMPHEEVDTIIQGACYNSAYWDAIRSVLEKEGLVVSN